MRKKQFREDTPHKGDLLRKEWKWIKREGENVPRDDVTLTSGSIGTSRYTY